jgi:hypothetical protein
VPVIA